MIPARLAMGGAVFLVSSVFAASARAEAPEPAERRAESVAPVPAVSPQATPPARSRAYIAQVLAGNVVGGAATAYLGIKTHTGLYESMAPYVLASPLVHVGHGNPGRATLSLLSRGIPILTTLGGALLDDKLAPCDSHRSDCDVPFVAFTILGFLAGVGAAGAIDVFLAQIPSEPPPPPQATMSLSFSTGPSGRTTLGLMGTF